MTEQTKSSEADPNGLPRLTRTPLGKRERRVVFLVCSQADEVLSGHRSERLARLEATRDPEAAGIYRMDVRTAHDRGAVNRAAGALGPSWGHFCRWARATGRALHGAGFPPLSNREIGRGVSQNSTTCPVLVAAGIERVERVAA